MNIVDSINRYLAGAETSKGERTRHCGAPKSVFIGHTVKLLISLVD